MEAVVPEDSPLADYLEGKGGEDVERTSDIGEDASTSSPSPSFAPRGRPSVRAKFRQKLPPPLQLTIPQNNAIVTIQNSCSRLLHSRLGRADNARFLERFRYIIVASQLLNLHNFLGQTSYGRIRDSPDISQEVAQIRSVTLTGVVATACSAFTLAWLINWSRGGGGSSFSGRSRLAIISIALPLSALVAYTYLRRQWLQYLRQQTLADISHFVTTAHDFDAGITGAMSLVQEVELVSRGYRISTPLPPISRLEDRSQNRRCARLRKQLRLSFVTAIPRYNQACATMKPLTEEMDLEKYYDIYDISDMDSADSMLGCSENEFDDSESVRVLKLLAARYHTTRKIFLCSLMAINASGGKADFLRWSTAMDEIQGVFTVTQQAAERLRDILTEEESFPVPPTPKLPLTPGRERWRAQLRKLNSLSSGIRGLQAKLHVLREVSDRHLDESVDVSELGTNLMIQYESVGMDLKALMQEWEDGKAALALNIDRNERRVSSMSGMLSPTSSIGGLTAVEEGTALDALNALNGEGRSRSSMDFSSSDAEEVFEAIAIPRQRSTLTREERIIKMKEDRIKRDSLNSTKEANTTMLRELQSVINMRPRGRAPGGRVTSL